MRGSMKRASKNKLDRSVSRKVAAKITRCDNRCFQNCYWGIRLLPGRAWFVLGLVEFEGETYRHTWIEWSERIVDPSLVGVVDGSMRYLPIARYSKNQLRQLPIWKLGRLHREPMFSEWYAIKGTGD